MFSPPALKTTIHNNIEGQVHNLNSQIPQASAPEYMNRETATPGSWPASSSTLQEWSYRMKDHIHKHADIPAHKSTIWLY